MFHVKLENVIILRGSCGRDWWPCIGEIIAAASQKKGGGIFPDEGTLKRTAVCSSGCPEKLLHDSAFSETEF